MKKEIIKEEKWFTMNEKEKELLQYKDVIFCGRCGHKMEKTALIDGLDDLWRQYYECEKCKQKCFVIVTDLYPKDMYDETNMGKTVYDGRRRGEIIDEAGTLIKVRWKDGEETGWICYICVDHPEGFVR